MLLHLLYLLAIVAEAMSGALMGMRRGMDRFGLCLVGTVTALGGGTVRDVLLGHYPLAWVSHPDYVLITIGAAASGAAGARWLRNWQRLFVTVDAIGLIAFTIIGCDVAATLDVSPAIVVLAGGFAVRMLAVRFRWQLKVFTTADSGGTG